MTPIEQARDAVAAVAKATPGEWYQPDGANGHIWNNDAEPGEGYTPDRVIFEGPVQPQWAKDRKRDEWYGENERNLAAAAAAVNFCRDHLPALIAENKRVAKLSGQNHDLYFAAINDVVDLKAENERLAERVAELEGALKPFAYAADRQRNMSTPHPRQNVVWSDFDNAARAIFTPKQGD